MFEIGIIVKPQGIKGELRVLPTTDDPSRFALLKEIYVRSPSHTSTDVSTMRKYTITSVRQQKGIVVLTLPDVNDRTTAEAMVNHVIVIPDAWALPLAEDEYFIRDLIGIPTYNEADEPLGEIADVLRTGANDVYVIQPPTGTSFMVPAIKDVVLNVDMKARRITLRLMDGLRELKA